VKKQKRIWLISGVLFGCLVILAVARHNYNQCKNFCSIRTQPAINPRRIVSLAPNLTEILFALGLGENIVAVSENCDWPAEVENIKKAGTFWQPNTEAIIASNPDLVVTLWFEQQKQVAQTLERMGYGTLTLRLEKISELSTAIRQIGLVTGRQVQAENLIRKINEQLDSLQSKYESKEKVKVLWVVQAEPLRVAGVNTFINELVEMAGGVNAIGSTIQQYPPISTEELLRSGAEVIIQAAMDTKDIEQQRKVAEAFWSQYSNLPAVGNKRIYVVEPDTILRLGPRLPEGLEKIISCLHGENNPQDS